MKKNFSNFFNRPGLVAAVSLAVACVLGTGWFFLNKPSVSGNQNLGPQNIIQSPDNPGVLTLGFLSGGRIKEVSVKVGDEVKKDEILASLDAGSTLGALTQARAAYAAAVASYQKVINGATGPTIDVSKAAVKTAEINLAEIKRQQDTLVANARRKLYSDGLVAISDDTDRRDIVPTISGVYNGEQSGKYKIYFDDFNDLYNRKEISFLGIERGRANMDDVPQPFGTKGLYIAFPIQSPGNDYQLSDRWTINIPNPSGANYTTNLNAYNAALQTRDQAVAGAEAQLTQAQAALAVTAATARPEDVAAAQAQVESARGSVQIAEAAYNNTVIRAPKDGTITAVRISVGQTATPNYSAIELSVTENN